MDTRKRNVLIGLGAAILVAVVALVVFTTASGSNQDEDASGNTVAPAADATAKDVGTIPSSGDGTASNQVDASKVFGDSSNAAGNSSTAGTSNSGGDTSSVSGSSTSGNQVDGSASSNQSGDTSNSGNGGSAENNNSASNESAGGADPGVKTEADGSTWTGYY